MRILIRKALAPILSKEARKRLKEREYNLRRYWVRKLPPLTEKAIRRVITDRLGVTRGDHLFVHGSLDMMRTEMTPLQLAELLFDIVGEEGSVSVPTFIRYTSSEWMMMPKPFHLLRTPSGMGVLSERVRRYAGSRRSLHPTKSVATVGKIAEEVLAEHHCSEFPFGPQSPFMKLLRHNVKVLGLGVPMSYLSLVHTVEDSNPDLYPLPVNEPKVYEKACVNEEGHSIVVKTRVHDSKVIVKANPERFVRRYVPRRAYHIHRHYLTPFFVVDGNQLYAALDQEMRRGRTIYD